MQKRNKIVPFSLFEGFDDADIGIENKEGTVTDLNKLLSNHFILFMKILVTGGAGFIGSHIQDRLIKSGHKVCVVDNLSTGYKKNLNPKAKFHKIDIRNKNLERIFKTEKFDVVYHEAAQIDLRKSVDDPIGNASINILGTINLLENCRKYKIVIKR